MIRLTSMIVFAILLTEVTEHFILRLSHNNDVGNNIYHEHEIPNSADLLVKDNLYTDWIISSMWSLLIALSIIIMYDFLYYIRRPGPPEPPIIEDPVRRVAQIAPLEAIARRQAEEPQAVFRGVRRGRPLADPPFDARILLGRGQNSAMFRVGRMRPPADPPVDARIMLGRGQNPAAGRGHGAPLRE